MPKVDLSLERELADSRTGECVDRLRVINATGPSIQLYDVSPRVPDGVELVEVKD